MKNTYKKPLVMLLAVLMLFCTLFPACGKEAPSEEIRIEGLPIRHEEEFGGVYIKITIDDFNKLGFRYGDSVKVVFSNGYTLDDVPYYNGYYVDVGEPLLIAYPGYDYIKAAVNYGADLWEEGMLYAGREEKVSLYSEASLDEHCTASVYLNGHGVYLDVQQARDIHYSDDRKDFKSDEIFANFRNVKLGNIGEGILYRSASPCDNQHNRAPYVDALIKEAGVGCILNLSDNEAKIEKYIAMEDFASPYFLSLYQDGSVIPLAMNMNFTSDEFREKLADGFTAMAEKEGPYLVHCTEGKDRTGFVCMLLEALAGASYQEIVDDYMLTYDNYYQINEKTDKAKYDVILEKNLIAMLYTVTGDKTVDLRTTDLSLYAKSYLRYNGMTDDAINRLLTRLAG